MTDIGRIYGQALYALAQDEGLCKSMVQELQLLDEAFRQEPEFLRLLSSPQLSKQERCGILDDSFRGRLQPYLLNFLKILTEKGYIRHFSDCRSSFTDSYNQDNGILPVKAITAVPLTPEQSDRLCQKLSQLTGKEIQLENRLDSTCLGGVRLDYDGKCLDDTVSHRIDAIRHLLHSTIL